MFKRALYLFICLFAFLCASPASVSADATLKNTVSVRVVDDITMLYWDRAEVIELYKKLLRHIKRSITASDQNGNFIVMMYGYPNGGGSDQLAFHY